jgi:hypothetical protein
MKVGQPILGRMTPVEYAAAHEVVDQELIVAWNYIHLSTKSTAPPFALKMFSRSLHRVYRLHSLRS